MGWGQKNARFYCEVHSARKHAEIILSNATEGLDIKAAGEHGCIRVETYTVREAEGLKDYFRIMFQPWRKSEGGRDDNKCVVLLQGPLDFDSLGAEQVTMRMNRELLTALAVVEAKNVLLEGTDI